MKFIVATWHANLLVCRKVTILVVGLDKAGKTSSIRGMLRGNTMVISTFSKDVVGETAQKNSQCVSLSYSWRWSRTHLWLRTQWAQSGELPGDFAGCRRISTVKRSLEGALWRSPWHHLCGGLQWQAADKGRQGSSWWPAETTKSGRKTYISVNMNRTLFSYIFLWF